ncbi:hypothetical protein BDL97_04G131900 [Sphagnum fallax]|nr:hypothetical protein BDL97_04G131900 [Sphagnum fallax]
MFWWCCVLCRFLISSKVTKYGIREFATLQIAMPPSAP